jgi:hypothetical protein
MAATDAQCVASTGRPLGNTTRGARRNLASQATQGNNMMRISSGARILAALFATLLATSAFAQKAPEVGYVFPASMPAGTTTEVAMGGYDWTPDVQLFASDPRVQLALLGPPGDCLVPPPPYWFGPKAMQAGTPIPRETPVRVTIAPDVPPGPVLWQVANANGGSAHAVLWVTSAADAREDERLRVAQALPALPVAVTGRIDRIEDVDRYRIRSERAGPVTVELFARRLGANFNGQIEVRDAGGNLLADAADTQGLDTAVTFTAAAGQEYEIGLHDVDFRGDWAYIYRLAFTPGPRIVASVPAAGRRGEIRDVRFIGMGVATGGSGLESITQAVPFPADPAVAAFEFQPQTPYGAATPFRLFAGDLPESIEPDTDSLDARRLTAPSAITGVLAERNETDRFQVEGKMGEAWSLAVHSRRLGVPLDVTLTVLGPDGVELVKNDDRPGTTDAALTFTVPADGLYTIAVADQSGHSGTAAAVYRLTVERPAPDFSLRMPELVNVTIGAKADLAITAARQGGFAGPIKLAIAGLPEGVLPEGELTIPEGMTELKVPLACAADAPALAALATVSGSAMIGEAAVTRTALAPAAGNLASRAIEDSLVPTVLVASVMKPRCKVSPVDKDGGRTVHRGTTYPAEVIVERLEGFTGEVLLRMAGRQTYHQQGIRGFDVPVAPGVTRTHYPCFMPEWLETARTSRMIVIAMAQVADPRGNVRWLVSPMDGRITMSVEGALLKVSHGVGELIVAAGQSFDVPVKVSRSPKLPLPATLELKLPDDLAGALSAEPVIVPPGATEATIRVNTTSDTRLPGEQTLTIRATALQSGNLPVVSETSFNVMFVPGP